MLYLKTPIICITPANSKTIPTNSVNKDTNLAGYRSIINPNTADPKLTRTVVFDFFFSSSVFANKNANNAIIVGNIIIAPITDIIREFTLSGQITIMVPIKIATILRIIVEVGV